MKTIFITACTVVCVLLFSTHSNAQATVADNLPIIGRYLGFSGGLNLEFRTNNITRMQLMQSGTSVVNGYTIDRSGFLGLSTQPNFFTTGAASPFALLHLNGDNPLGFPESLGYRPWMRHGVVYTHNQDIMYVGPRRVGADDRTDAVIAWEDNSSASQFGPDNLTFIYTTGDGSAPNGAGSMGGLEVARMTTDGHTGIGINWSNAFQPKRTLDVVRTENIPQFRITRAVSPNIDLGTFCDFQVSNLGHLHLRPAQGSNNRNVAIGFLPVVGNATTNPTERIDVLGTARLREMLSNQADVLITGVQQSAAGDYALNYLSFTGDNSEVLAGDGSWVDISNFGCEWNIIPNATTGDNDLVMGYPGACNEGFVRIGTATNFGGFQPRMTLESNSNSNAGLFSFVQGEIGIGTLTQGTIWQTVGVLSRTLTTEGRSIGVLGISGSNSNVIASIGVAGVSSTSGPSYGLYGEGSTAALYLVGNTVSSGQSFGLSDMNFKTNLTDEVPGISELMLLTPKAYQFKTEEFPHMKMPTGTQYGLIAQEVQEYHPQLVREFEKPEIIDNETGEIISPGEEYLALDYVSLIPILIKSIQEQQSMIEAQQAQIEMLTEMVGDCCNAAKSNTHPPAGENQLNGFRLQVDRPMLNQNSPNPFTSSTLITYRLPKATFARLRVVNTSGQTIEVLTEGQQSEGEYRVVWNGDHLAPGTYIYILEADGVEIAKRAIKMN